MTTSFPSCARRHPGTPSQIVMSECTYRGEGKFGRRYCRVCKQLIAKEQDLARRGLAAQGDKAPAQLQPYGVIALNWPAPERLEIEAPCH